MANDEKEISGAGWTLESFGIDEDAYDKAVKPSQGFSPNFTAGLSGGGNQPVLPGTNQFLAPGYEVAAAQSLSALDLGLVTPEQQGQVQAYLDDPSFFDQKVEQSKRFLGRLFDIDDPKETAVESVWDGFLTGVHWTYDRLSQVTTAGLSGLPGGVRTLSWAEADDVSPGQIQTVNAALAWQAAKRGDAFGGLTGLLQAGTLPLAGTAIKPNLLGPDFDITSEADRQRVFTEDPVGKWTSGLTDAVYAVFGDPLIVGGKALKVARIRWVDQPVVSAKQRTQLANNLAADAVAIENGGVAASTQGQFLQWAGEAGRTVDEVYNHPVMRYATERDLLTSMFLNAENFSQRSLIMRVAYGDDAARAELLNQKASLALMMGDAQRARLDIIFALRPDQVNKIRAFYSRKFAESSKQIESMRAAGATDEQLARQLQKHEQFSDYVYHMRRDEPLQSKMLIDPLEDTTKEALGFQRQVINEYLEKDNFLRKAVDAEYENALTKGSKNFSVSNTFGRAIESSRQRRAVASAEMQGATFKSVWTSSEYTPFGKFGRTVRLWRWMGNEKPAGYITTRGTNIQEQYREIRANLDNIGLYSGPDKFVLINGKQILVGGEKRREELARRYIDAVGASVEDQNKIARAVTDFETQVMRDIGAVHGLTKDGVDQVIKRTQSKRHTLIEQIRENRGFWYDPDTKKMELVPFLESHLQNGTYLINFRAFERAARISEKSGQIRKLNELASVAGEKAANAYDIFNSLWRPSVLLRFGYTQRNFVEGAFRAAAFTGSLAPLVYASKATGFGFRNVVAKKLTAREAARVEKGMGGKKFNKWRLKQQAVLEKRIEAEEEWVRTRREMLDDMDKSSREYATNRENVDIIEAQIADLRNRRELLQNDAGALSLYKAQGADKRRLFDGEFERTDPFLSYKAFGNPRFSDVAWANMSASATTRATLSLRLSTDESLFYHKLNKQYVDVKPDMGDDYFKGVAEMLKQFRQSDVAQRLMQDSSEANQARIATWLMESDEGRDIVRFLNGAFTSKKKKDPSLLDAPIRDFDDALEYVKHINARIESLLPAAEAKALLKNDDVIFSDDLWKVLKRILDTDEHRNLLIPAVGNIAKETATKSIREMINTATDAMFKFLGTIPEDALVRGPFYGRIYQDTRAVLMRQLNEDYAGKTIPFAEIARREALAHKRALKDTKDFLYTIERRTNLGTYGEYIIPFISAMQNSITALGKLTWRDPSIIGFVNLLWQAPNRGGMEDENGNIIIPLPHAIIPDGIERAVGLDNMRNIKINKGSLNVIFPETGYGFAPRPGPLLAVPASEIMKKGWFGMGVDTPVVLREFFGDEAGDELWTQWRKYIFGEEDGLSAEALSWDMWTSPAVAKIAQMIQGEGGSTSYAYMYNLQYRTELAKILAGERDFPESEEEFRKEIKDRTNGMFMLRALANLTAFTPPQYESKLEPLIETLRMYEQNYDDGLRRFNEDYGDMLVLVGDFSVSQNVAGVQANVAAVENARKYENIIGSVAPNIQDDLSVLGILLNEDPNGLYDDSAYAWQRATVIPGLNVKYREIQTPEQAMVETQKNAGWTKFISFMDEMDVILQQRGLQSYKAAGARDLVNYKKQYVEKLRTDPLYEGWYSDYMNFGSTRTISAIKVLEAALRDEKFVEDHADDPKWQSAYQYLELRREILLALEQSGSGINTKKNAQIRWAWDAGRQRLKMQSTQWASIANRYLNGDDDPVNPGVTLDEVLLQEIGGDE